MDKSQRSYLLRVSTEFGETVEIKPPFTIEFDVTRNVLSSASTSSIRIYNLAETTRKKIYKDNFPTNVYRSVELKAGYGEVMPTIFKGNVLQAWSVREGNNFITTIEAQDGGFAFLVGEFNQAFPAGTPINIVLETIIKTLPNVNRGAVGSYAQVLSSKKGTSLSGNSAELLNTLSNGGFFIDSEKAYCLGDTECVPGSIQVITSASGLLGTPVREKTILNFDMLFEPRLLIGQLVSLVSITEKNFNGFYKVISLKHRAMISETVCGTAVTSVGLWYGSQKLRVVF